MRAGEHDRVGAPAVPRRRSRARSRRRCRRRRPAGRAARPPRWRRGCAEPTRVTSQPWPKSRISARVYSRLTVASVPSTDTSLDLRRRAGRLDRRHGADERHREARPQLRQHQGRRGVAGDHHDVGRVRRDQLRHQRHHAADQLLLAVAPIGKERIVGDIDERASGRAFATSRNTVRPPRPESNTRMVGVAMVRHVPRDQSKARSRLRPA